MIFTHKKAIININDDFAVINFSNHFKHFVLSNMKSNHKNIVFLCIGTDRSTGDSLGPLIGYKLSSIYYDNVSILGTLEEPVHAKNLSNTVSYIEAKFSNPFIIAIDACLGHQENIGHINISNGPIYPGAGVNKNLMPVGNINISGVVNTAGYMEYFILQNTRLNLVMKMADIITDGILNSINEIYSKLNFNCLQI